MKIWIFVAAWLAAAHGALAESCPSAPPLPASAPANAEHGPERQLYVRDGQLVSWDLRMHVAPDLPAGATPRLCLYAGHALTSPTATELQAQEPRLLAAGQKFVGGAAEDGADAMHVGTLLHFAPRGGLMPIWKPMMRVRAVLTWTEADGRVATLVAPHTVNIGQAPTAWALSLALVGAFLVSIILLARRGGVPATALLLHDDGHLSLSKVQMAGWTLVVGTVLLFFATVQLRVPDIPASLVVLMGMSLITTGAAYQADGPAQPSAAGPVAWKLLDLIAAPDGRPGLSLSRAQMLFWTTLLMVVFVAKSVLTGEMWSIPWELVSLMGVSQAGYVLPKLSSP